MGLEIGVHLNCETKKILNTRIAGKSSAGGPVIGRWGKRKGEKEGEEIVR